MKKLLTVLLLVCSAAAVAQEVLPPQDTTYDVAFQPAGAVLQQIDTTGGTVLSSGDDVNDIVSIGFDFTFYGITYNTVNISSNGFLSFTDFGNGCCGSELQFGSPNTIYALWMDLVANSSTYYKTYDLNGQTVFTAGWYNTYELGSPSTFHNFEITLYSGTNDFSITYGNNMAPASPYSAGIIGPAGEQYAIQPYGTDQSIISNTTYYFSLAAVPPPPEQPIGVDCSIAPSDPTCVINSIIDTATDTALADNTATTGEDSLPVEEEQSAAEEAMLAELLEKPVSEEAAGEELLEELLAEDLKEDSVNSLADELVASELADEIETETMEGALSSLDSSAVSVAEAAVAVALTATAGSGDSSRSSRSAETQIAVAGSAETQTMADSSAANTQSADSSADAMEILAAGQVMGQAAQTENAAVSESSAMNSLVEAEQISATQSVASTESAANSFSNSETMADTAVDNAYVDSNTVAAETVAMDVAKTAGKIDDGSFRDESEINEAMTVAFDPLLASTGAFNAAPNLMNLEAAGLMNQRQEEKSDAEKQADKVVAANAKEQEEINNNYMDADQSGIVAAMGADADVSSYRSAMLQDNSGWYKPEDIYKGVVYKDNVRGAYFLEKGSTDTYKKMVGEQYK